MNIFKKLTVLIITAFLFIFAYNQETTKKELIIFHAGSLSVPIKSIAKEFEKINPDVEIKLEAAGSRRCARKISDLHKSCDIMASADYTVIDKLLIPDYADWNIKFASNEMTIVYIDKSKYSDIINKDNWYNILLKDDVVYGRSDPNVDPCGYRASLTCKLAEKFYKIEGLAEEILAKNNEYIRPKETDLLGMLESNNIDYIFLYRSVAQQHNLNYITLPDSINLKFTALKDFYASVSTEISGKKPGQTITKKGAPMIYGITIPTTSKHPKLAIEFLYFFLNKEKGMKILKEAGQPSVIPSFSQSYNDIPESLQKFAIK